MEYISCEREMINNFQDEIKSNVKIFASCVLFLHIPQTKIKTEGKKTIKFLLSELNYSTDRIKWIRDMGKQIFN